MELKEAIEVVRAFVEYGDGDMTLALVDSFKRRLEAVGTLLAHAENAGQWKPSNADIEKMVSRFLCWKLPIDFTPDGGINFSVRLWPTGTNLFCSSQAEEMFRHCLDVPLPATPAATKDEL